MLRGVISLLGLLSLLCLIIGMIYPKPFYRFLPQDKQRRLWVFLLFSGVFTVCGVLTTATSTSIPEQITGKAQAAADYTNSISMEFTRIPAGSFERKAFRSENVFTVTISKPFYLGTYEVTQAQWEAVMGNNPAHFKGRHNPVENVSSDDIQLFISNLNAKEGHNRYRLPTQAEWEYAARAGTTTTYSFGNNEQQLGEYAWFDGNSRDKTHPAGQKKPNPWGLYDMHGNVWELVQDWGNIFNDYPSSNVTDPKEGPSSGFSQVIRGGSWRNKATHCGSASHSYLAQFRNNIIGFRLALDPE